MPGKESRFAGESIQRISRLLVENSIAHLGFRVAIVDAELLT